MKKLSLVLMLVLCGIGTILAQRTVTGTLTDDAGEPLIGASVLVKGTTTGTVTDIDGTYSVDMPEGASVLIFSYTGYKTTEVEVGASNILDLAMAEGVTLETAVVTALGVERDEKAIGYAVQQVDGDAIARSGANNTLDALRGKAAGVNVIRASGAAGGGTRILIRGQTSMTGNNQALIVVDGVRIDNSTFQSETNVAGVANSNRLMDLNPADIASLNVLKGAAATALYGVDGANGVVVITTKRGSGAGSKKYNVTLNSSVAWDVISQTPELQTTYAQGSGGTYFGPETGAAQAWGPLISDLAYNGDSDYLYDSRGALVPATDPSAVAPAQAFDHIDQFFQTGLSWNNTVAVSGGNDNANFRFSYGNLTSEGIVPNNRYNRNTFKLASDLKLTDKLSVSASVNYAISDATRVQQGSNTSGLMLGLLRTPPSFDNTGGYDDPVNTELAYRFADGKQRNYRGGGGYDNPFWTVNLTPRTDEVNRIFGNIRADYKLHQWANFSVNLGTDAYSDRRKQKFELNSRNAPSGRIFEDQWFFRNFDSYFNLNGSGNLTDDFTFGYLVGANIYNSNLNNLYTQGDGLSFRDFVQISNASEVQAFEANYNEKNVGFYGSIDLSYGGFLYLSATARQDWVSTLIVPNAFDGDAISFFYPSANLGIVFSEWLNDDSFLSFGKLRLSYAQVGGGAPDPYATSTVFVGAGPTDGWVDGIAFPFQGVNGFTLGNQLGNHLLEPENTTTLEAGIDVRFLKGRLGLDVTYYENTSENQILPVDLAGTTGYTEAVLNSGTLAGRGVEIILNATPIRNRNVTWDILVNFDHNETTIEKLADGLRALQIGGFTGTGIFHIEGQPFGQIYGGAYLTTGAGTDADDGLTIPEGDILINDDVTSAEYGFQMPDPVLRVLGDPNPDFTVGFNNSLTVKDFNLSFLIDWKQGGQMWNGTGSALTFFGTNQVTAENRDEVVVFDGVKSDGSPNDIPVNFGQNYWNSSVGGFGNVDQGWVQSTTWVRLREISLSWNFKPEWFTGSFVEGGALTVTGRNVWFWTPYTGVDPETSLTGTNNAQGFDYFNMPGTRTYSVGLNLNF